MKKKISVCSLLFCSFLALTALLFAVLPKKDYSTAEKRYLADFPTLSFNNITDGSFGRDFEAYLSDHFPFRTFFVGVNAYFKLCLGNNGSGGYYKAKDGFIIAKPALYNEERLLKNINKVNAFAEKTDIPASFLLIPTTGYLLKDKLPVNAEPYHDETVFELFQKNLSDKIQLIDVRSAFSRAQDPCELYYKTDHHITAKGAFTAYNTLCEAWNIPAAEQSIFKIQTVGGFYGTAYSGSGYFLEKPDTVELWKSGNITATVFVGDNITEKEPHNGVFFEERLTEDDKYPVYLNGNHGYVHIRNEAAKNGSVLLIKDSFAHCLSCFLCENYRDIYLFDLRYYKYPLSDFVKDKKIDRLLYVYGVNNFLTDSNLSWLK